MTDPGLPLLQLNLHSEHFDAIAGTPRTKWVEWRRICPHWTKRLVGRKYRAIRFCNGYGKTVPEMIVEFLGVRRVPGKRLYAIRLGRVLEVRRWPRKP